MSEMPTFKPEQMGFFSEWFIVITWPDGQQQKMNGFRNEAHCQGWIEHESAKWVARTTRPRGTWL